MKKLISIILSLALVACMFGMSAMAADVLKQPVGTHGNGSIDDGWTDAEFDSNKSATADVLLTLGAVQSRYAVDIVFTGTFALTAADLTWDVNELKYVSNGNVLDDQDYSFTVTNYSDKSVGVTAAADVVAGAEVTFVAVTPGETGDTDNVAADYTSCTIVGNAGGNDVANTAKFSATLESTDWAGTINTLVGTNPDATSFKLVTFTVTISK